MPLNFIIDFHIIRTCAGFFNKDWRLKAFDRIIVHESQGEGQEKLPDVQLDSFCRRVSCPDEMGQKYAISHLDRQFCLIKWRGYD